MSKTGLVVAIAKRPKIPSTPITSCYFMCSTMSFIQILLCGLFSWLHTHCFCDAAQKILNRLKVRRHGIYGQSFTSLGTRMQKKYIWQFIWQLFDSWSNMNWLLGFPWILGEYKPMLDMTRRTFCRWYKWWSWQVHQHISLFILIPHAVLIFACT